MSQQVFSSHRGKPTLMRLPPRGTADTSNKRREERGSRVTLLSEGERPRCGHGREAPPSHPSPVSGVALLGRGDLSSTSTLTQLATQHQAHVGYLLFLKTSFHVKLSCHSDKMTNQYLCHCTLSVHIIPSYSLQVSSQNSLQIQETPPSLSSSPDPTSLPPCWEFSYAPQIHVLKF